MVYMELTLSNITSENFPAVVDPITQALEDLYDVPGVDIHVTFNEETGNVDVNIQRRNDEEAEDLTNAMGGVPETVMISTINNELSNAGLTDVAVNDATAPTSVEAANSGNESDGSILFGFNLMVLIVIGIFLCAILLCCYGIYASCMSKADKEFDDGFFSKVQRRASGVKRRASRLINFSPSMDASPSAGDSPGPSRKVELHDFNAHKRRQPEGLVTPMKPGRAKGDDHTPEGLYSSKKRNVTATPRGDKAHDSEKEPLTPKALAVMEGIYQDCGKSPSVSEKNDDGDRRTPDGYLKKYDSRSAAATTPYDAKDGPKRRILSTTTTEIEYQLQHHEIQSGIYLHKTDSTARIETDHMDIQSGAYLERDATPRKVVASSDLLNDGLDDFMSPFTPIAIHPDMAEFSSIDEDEAVSHLEKVASEPLIDDSPYLPAP